MSFNRQLTLMISRRTVTTCQLSVENAMASSAAATSENMEAKQSVTALQKAILGLYFRLKLSRKLQVF